MVSEGYTGWSRRDTRGASSIGQMDKSEAWEGTKEYEREKEKEAEEEEEEAEEEDEDAVSQHHEGGQVGPTENLQKEHRG